MADRWKTYEKRKPVRAHQLEHPIHAEAGDYIVEGDDGGVYAVPRERFEKLYERETEDGEQS